MTGAGRAGERAAVITSRDRRAAVPGGGGLSVGEGTAAWSRCMAGACRVAGCPGGCDRCGGSGLSVGEGTAAWPQRVDSARRVARCPGRRDRRGVTPDGSGITAQKRKHTEEYRP
ncbi:hypothetical protein SUDANB145_06097 [Streptomyces sp. enrichment culture]